MLTGPEGEALALDYLQNHGLRLVCRNFRCRMGEIDLIMQEAETLVFVEVRFRSGQRFGGASESIDRRKRLKICKTAGYYLSGKRLDCPCRFDVVAISPAAGRLEVQWLKDAFQVET